MKAAPRRASHRIYALGGPVWNALYRRPWLVVLLAPAIFFPLLNARGLYEYADTNFPLNPFWIDYVLPWSGAASAGADNTFIGVPRLIYHLVINALIGTFHSLQLAQWLWYSAEGALGIAGAFLLARRLGAGRFAIPLSIFYAFNLWSYDRVAQSLIFLSYEALPLSLYLYLRYLERPRLDRALYFAVSVVLIIPAPQVTYLAVVVCAGIAVRAVLLRGWKVAVHLAALGAAVLAACAFYVFTMIADWLLNSGGGIALVNQRFTLESFVFYSTRVGLWNTARLSSFFYSTSDRQSGVVTIACTLLPLLLLGLIVVARRPSLRSKFYCGLALSLLGLWLVDGIALWPAGYEFFRTTIPGLRSFVEPDYYAPLYIAGAFVMLASGLRLAARVAPWISAIVWFVALAGVVPFLPIGNPMAGLPQTAQPRQYAEFSRRHVLGSTLWMPADRDVTYRWSPYVINGFTSLNSPSDAIGPTMKEWVSTGTDRLQSRLADAMELGQTRTVRALAPLLGIGTIAVAADSLGPQMQWPNFEVEGSLDTLHRLTAAGFVTSVDEQRDDGVRLVTASTIAPPDEMGVFDAPQSFATFDDFLWWEIAHAGSPYRPSVDLSDEMRDGATFEAAIPAPVESIHLPAAAFTRIGSCHGPSTPHPLLARSQSLSVTTVDTLSCVSLTLPNPKRFGAVQFTVDSSDDSTDRSIAFSDGRQTHLVAAGHTIAEIPSWAHSVSFVAIVLTHRHVVLNGITLHWLGRAAASPPPVSTCDRAGVRSWEVNPMVYAVSGDLRGACTVVFRQSFSPVWALWTRGPLQVGQHFQADGFANGWLVRGSGTVTMYAVNVLIVPYCAGLLVSLLCLLLTAVVAFRTINRRLDVVPAAVIP